MASDSPREKAQTPEDIIRLFRQFVAAGDFAGLATLYEDDAVLALPPGQETHGSAAIAAIFEKLMANRPAGGGSGGESQPVIRNGGLALTSTRLPNGQVTAEIARQQPDGSWRWVIDQPGIRPAADMQ
ncbi:nuclear transport factor 2 family protein [bacterium]|nr:nuclear transport factor 2 family protein [bacterium]